MTTAAPLLLKTVWTAAVAPTVPSVPASIMLTVKASAQSAVLPLSIVMYVTTIPLALYASQLISIKEEAAPAASSR